MSFAWTTLLVIILIQPGFAFFVGLHSAERHTRDGGQGRTLIELALTTFVAVIIHALFFAGFQILQVFPFEKIRVLPFFNREIDFTNIAITVEDFFPLISTYILLTTVVGWYSGFVTSQLITNGQLRVLATHKWVYDLVKNNGFVNAFILTTTVEDKRMLMYSGYLKEIFLDSTGEITNLVMAGCSRYYMTFDEASPGTGTRNRLVQDGAGSGWDYFVIPGNQIANTLFSQSKPIDEPSQRGMAYRTIIYLSEKIRAFQTKLASS